MYRTVIVEDDAMVAMLNRTYLEKDGRFRVTRVFSGGQAALSYLTAHPADLLVLDVFMPMMTGLELLRELRARGVDLDVIMVTAAHDAKTLDALLKLGVVDYLVKPFTYARFKQALDTFCQHRDTLAGWGSVSQSEIDRLLQAGTGPAAPKGLQERTLERIRLFLKCEHKEHTCEEIGGGVGLSAVTVRRYLNYMMEQGEVDSEVRYDTGGRPGTLYRYREGS